jgi:hypothetical protein
VFGMGTGVSPSLWRPESLNVENDNWGKFFKQDPRSGRARFSAVALLGATVIKRSSRTAY